MAMLQVAKELRLLEMLMSMMLFIDVPVVMAWPISTFVD